METTKDQLATTISAAISSMVQPSPLVRLRLDLWFDPTGCALISGRQRIPLTAQETDVLAFLAQAPRAYLKAGRLAHLLDPLANPPIEPHCVEQTISTLRRKLGEDGKRQQLIRTHRRKGYALCPQLDPAS